MKISKSSCDLKSCFLCKLCLKEWLPAINANRKTFLVKKGEIIFKEGDDVTGIYFVYNGSFKVQKKWGRDKELIVRIARKGAILGHRGLGVSTIYPVSGTALEPSTVCFIDLEFFHTTLKVNHNFTYELMMFFAEELQVSERHMRDLAHMNVKGRVAQALLSLADMPENVNNQAINSMLSRQDLASLTGTTYETVFRIINELVEEKSITLSGKDIKIADESKLRKHFEDAG